MLLNVIEGPYLRDLLDQPTALRNTCESLADHADLRRIEGELRGGAYRRVVLTGMGSSYHALYPLHLTLSRAGVPSHWIETSELIHYMRELLATDTLLVAVSQSGQSAETVGLLELVRGMGPLIAVTNNAESPLAQAASIPLLMHAGPESSVSCKTYLTSLLTLEWLSAILTGQDLALVKEELGGAAALVAAYLRNFDDHVERIRREAQGVRQVFVVGRGPSLATAGTGGLILKESVRFSAEGMSSAAFRHGPFETLNDSVLVVVMAGDVRTGQLNRRLAQDICEAGGRSQIVDMSDARPEFRIPSAGERLRQILEILPVQMLSLALAAMSGREPGRFELASKVTTTE